MSLENNSNNNNNKVSQINTSTNELELTIVFFLYWTESTFLMIINEKASFPFPTLLTLSSYLMLEVNNRCSLLKLFL